MAQKQVVRRLKRSYWRAIESLLRESYREGVRAGLARAHGGARRGRTVRGDATVDGLVRLIEGHFGLERYGFEVRVVHSASGRRVAGSDQIRKYRIPA